jgi:hypothetical protein
VCSHLLEAFREVIPFSSADHRSVRAFVTAELKSHRTELNEVTLASILTEMECDTCRTIDPGNETGAWLRIMSSTLNGTKLFAGEHPEKLAHWCKIFGMLS